MRGSARKAIVVATAALTVGGMALTAQATFPGDNGRIAFSSNRSGRFQIYTISPHGRRLQQLTNAPGNSVIADWTPDGERIVFDTDRVTPNCAEDCNVEIFIMDADGSNETRLTRNRAFDGDPAVSPDGEWIAFWSDRDGGDPDIFVMRIDGSRLVQLTHNDGSFDQDPSWSPDGRWLAFASNRRGGVPAVYKMRIDGTDVSRLTPLRLRAGVPDWSPEGDELAFASNADVDQPSDIYTVDSNGSDLSRLTRVAEEESYFFPSWSPNGRKIVVSHFSNENVNIAIITARSGRLVWNVTTNPAIDFAPDWGRRD
jgi:Tol biopolymer transport system component